MSLCFFLCEDSTDVSYSQYLQMQVCYHLVNMQVYELFRVCPLSIFVFFPVCTSHKRTVLSKPTVASVLPSGEYAALITLSVCCPVKSFSAFPVVTA